MDKKTPSHISKKVKEELDYPGVAINHADKDKTTPELVKEDVKDLNNNPRNNDL